MLAVAFLFWAANQLWPDLRQATLFNDVPLRSSSSMCSWSWSAGQRHHRTSPLLKPTLSHIRKGNLKRRVVNCSLPRPHIRLLFLGKSTCFVPSDGHQRPVVASRRPARFEPAGFGRQVSPPVGVFAEVPEHPDHKDHGEAYWNEKEHGGVNGVHHSNSYSRFPARKAADCGDA